MAKGIKKEKKLSWYKDKAWEAFSRFIRTRDCLFTTGDPDWGKCVTCQKMTPFKQLQAGHFIAGRSNAILFDEQAVNIQCYGCNVGKKGNYVEYYEYMLERYGRDVITELRGKKYMTVKFDRTMLTAIKEHYEEETQKLLQVYHEGVPTLSTQEVPTG